MGDNFSNLAGTNAVTDEFAEIDQLIAASGQTGEENIQKSAAQLADEQEAARKTKSKEDAWNAVEQIKARKGGKPVVVSDIFGEQKREDLNGVGQQVYDEMVGIIDEVNSQGAVPTEVADIVAPLKANGYTKQDIASGDNPAIEQLDERVKAEIFEQLPEANPVQDELIKGQAEPVSALEAFNNQTFEYGPADIKKERINQRVAEKQQKMVEKVSQKRSKFTPFKFPTIEEFDARNPAATEQERQAVILGRAKEEQREAEYDLERDIRHAEDRGIEGVAKDTALQISQFGIDTGSLVYAGADLISRGGSAVLSDGHIPSLDEATGGFSKNFDEANAILDEFKTDATNLSKKKVELQKQGHDIERLQRIQNSVAEGNSPLQALLKEEGSGFVNTLQSLVSEPLAAADIVMRSAPNFLLGAGIGRVVANKVTKSATKNMDEAAAKAWMKSDKGQETIRKAGRRANISFVSVQEGFSNGIQAKAEVLRATPEQMAKSPDYNELRERGFTHKQAVMKISNDVFDIVAGLSAIIGGGAAKFTGAGDVIGNLFNGVPTKKLFNGVLGKFVTGGALEGIEETIQGAGGTFAQNVGTQQKVDPDQEVLEGIGPAGAEGLVAGIASAGPVSAVTGVGESAKNVAKAAKTTAKVGAKVAKAVGKKVQFDPKAAGYSAVEATKAAFDKVDKEKVKDKANSAVGEVVRHSKNVQQKLLDTSKDIIDAEKRGDTKYVETLKKKSEKLFNESREVTSKAAAVISKYIDEKTDTNIAADAKEILKNTKETIKNKTAAADYYLGSGPINNDENLKAIIADKKVPEERRVAAQNMLDLSQHIQQAASLKSFGKVSEDVIEGGNGHLGVKDHTNIINQALLTGNSELAQNAMVRLKDFAKFQSDKFKLLSTIKNSIEKENPDQAAIGEYNAKYRPAKSPFKFTDRTFSGDFLPTVGKEVDILNATIALQEQIISDVLPTVAENPVIAEAVAATGAPIEASETSTTPDTKTSESTTEEAGAVNEEATAEETTEQSPAAEAKSPATEKTESKPEGKTERDTGNTIQTRTDKKGRVTTVTEEVTEKDGITTTKYIAKREGKEISGPHVRMSKGTFLDLYNLTENSLDNLNNFENIKEIRVKEIKQSTDGRNVVDIVVITEDGAAIEQTHTFSNPTSETASEAKPEAKQVEEEKTEPTPSWNAEESLAYDGEILNHATIKPKAKALDTVTDNSFIETVKTYVNNFAETFNEIHNPFFAEKQIDKLLVNDTAKLLLGADGKFAPEVIEAMGTAAYKWLATIGSTTVFNDDDAIRSILGLSENDEVGDYQRAQLRSVGRMKSNIAEDIGHDVMNQLGIKFKDDANGTLDAAMALTIGQRVLGAMAKRNQIIITPVPTSVFEDQAPEDGKTFNTLPFVTVPSELVERTAPSGRTYTAPRAVKNILNIKADYSNSENNAIFNEVTGDETALVLPGSTPPKNLSKKIRKTSQESSEEQRKIVNNHQKRVNRLNQGINKVLEFVSKETLLDFGGYVSDTAGLHKTEREGVEANNDQIERAFDNHFLLVEDMKTNRQKTGGLGSPIHFAHRFWKTHRLGMEGLINPQNNKIHRHTIYMDDWKAELDKNNPEHMLLFKLAVLEGMDKSINKMTPAESLRKFDEMLKSDVVQRGVAALNYINSLETNNELDHPYADAITSEETQAQAQEFLEADLREAVKSGGENMWSLDALMAIAAYQNAKDGQFTTTLFREIDGITNGVILGLMQFAGASSFPELMRHLNKGGVYLDGQWKSFNEFRQGENNQDSYENLTENIRKYLGGFAKSLTRQNTPEGNIKLQQITAAVRLANQTTPTRDDQNNLVAQASFVDPKSKKITSIGRGLSKKPLMTIIYGAGSKKVISDLAYQVLAETYARMAKVARDVNLTEQERTDTLNLIQQDISSMIGEDFRITDPFSSTLNGFQYAQFVDTFSETYGAALSASIKKEYGTFLDIRKSFNGVIGLSFDVFQSRLKTAVEKLEAAKGRPLSIKETEDVIDSLQNVSPIIRNYFSKTLKEGLLFTKEKRKRRAYDDDGNLITKKNFKGEVIEPGFVGTGPTETTVEFAKNANIPVVGSKKGQRTFTATPSETAYEAPGVSGGVIGIHQLDAAIMLQVLADMSILNIHDAGAVNVLDTNVLGQAFNQSTFETMANYYLVDEAVELLRRLSTNMTNKEKRDYEEDVIKAATDLSIQAAHANNLRDQMLDPETGIARVGQYDSVTEEGVYEIETAITQLNDLDFSLLDEIVANIIEETPTQDTNSPNTVPTIPAFTGYRPKTTVDFTTDTVMEIKDVDGTTTVYLQLTDNKRTGTVYDLTGTELKTFNIPKGTIKDTVTSNLQELTLGSGHTNVNQDSFVDVQAEHVTSDNTLDVFDSLGVQQNGEVFGHKVENEQHQSYLRGLIGEVLNTVIQPFDLFKAKYGDTNIGDIELTSGDIRVQGTLNANQAMLASGVHMSAQEVFTHEMVHAISAHGINTDYRAAQRLRRLFKLVKQQVTPADFMNTNEFGTVVDSQGLEITDQVAFDRELAAATERYDYIFNNTDIDEQNRNAYLQEFMAHGLTNESFIKKLASIKITEDKLDAANDTNNVWSGIKNLFSRFMNSIFGIMSHKAPRSAYAELGSVLGKVSQVQQRRESDLMNGMDNMNHVSKGLLGRYVVEPLEKLLSADTLAGSGIPLVQEIGSILQAVPHISSEGYRRGLRKTLNRHNRVQTSFWANISDELLGPGANQKTFETAARKATHNVDQQRMKILTSTVKVVNSMFTEELSDEQKRDITQAVLMTDLSILLPPSSGEVAHTFSTDKIQKLLEDPGTVDAKIAAIELELKNNSDFSNEHYNWYRKQARNLGTFMAQGTTTEEGDLVLNAGHIASTAGNPHLAAPNSLQYAERRIDVLATLHAIKATDDAARHNAAQLMLDQRTGMEFTLNTHTNLKEEALEKSFAGQKGLMVKGYISELTNPAIAYQVANEENGKKLMARGYKKHPKPLAKDNQDPNRQTLHYYVSPHAQLNSLDTGIVSYTNETAKGTSLLQNHLNSDDANAVLKAQSDFAVVKAKKETAMLRIMADADSSKQYGNPLVATRNAQGEIVDYRYVMGQENKRGLLQKNESFDQVLGAMAANIIDKVETKKTNEDAVEKAKADFDENFLKEPNAYVLVGPLSSDPKAREIYNMLPQAMKDHIKTVWGQNGMYVHQSAWRFMFGQRKISFSSLQMVETEGLQGLERIKADTNNILTHIFHNNVGLFIEGTWQDFVSTVKDTIVIRSIQTLVFNVLSNQFTLLMMGVPPNDAVRWQKEAWDAAKEYQAAEMEINELTLKMNVDPKLNTKANKARIAELTDVITNNPVKELFDAGVYQSINEDIYTLDDTALFKSNIEQLVQPVTDRINPKVKHALSTVTLKHNTAIYDMLKDGTQLSDFIARYALHKNNIRKGKDPKESIDQIVRVFVNYDTPTDPWLQYANDMGAVFFTKYFLRTQRVIFELFRDRPASVAVLLAMQNITGPYLPNIIDSNIFNLPNPNSPFDVAGGLTTHPLYWAYNSL